MQGRNASMKRASSRVRVLALGFFVTLPALAQVVSAPGGPQVGQAGNGVPVVDINAANGAGVSHNRYTEFNVERRGLILNNQTATGQTQLGGYVLRNENLQQSGAARLIVNEVNGVNRSQLNGYMEVAGQKAGVVVANPNGISCDGCGFVNTNQATLTTGTPQFNAEGALHGYHVTGGALQINGQGLDANSTDRIALIARAVQINAGLWAKDANVIAGAAIVDANTLQQQALAGDDVKPQVGIDVSALGGMYANRIRLVSGETGVGVASAGELGANGDLTIDSAGNVRLTGKTVASGGALRVNGAGELVATGAQAASQDLTFNAGGNVQLGGTTQALGGLRAVGQNVSLTGTTSANGDVAIVGRGDVAVAGQTYSGGNLTLDAQGRLSTQGQLQAQGALTAQAGQTFDNQAVIAAQSIQAQAARFSQAQGAGLSAQQTNTLRAGQVDNAGTLYAGQSLQLSSDGALRNTGAIGSDGDLSITANTLENRAAISAATRAQLQIAGQAIQAGTLASGGDLSLSAGSLQHAGQTYAGGNATVAAAGAMTNSGVLSSRDGLTITAQSVNSAGELGTETGDLSITTHDDTTLAGKSVAGGALIVDAGGHLTQTGRAHGQTLTLTAAGDLVQTGTVTATGAAVLQSGGALDNQGDVQAAALTLRGDRVTNDGRLLAEGDIAISGRTLTNTDRGVIAAGLQADGSIGGQANATLTATESLNQHGQVLAGGAVALTGQRVDARNATTQVGTDLTITAGQGGANLDNATTSARGNLSLSSAGDISHRNAQSQGASVAVNAASFDNTDGALLQTGATGALTTQITGALINTRGRLAGNAANVDLRAGAIDNSAGRIEHGGRGTLSLNATGAVNNASGVIAGNGDIALNAANVTNASGTLSAGRTATLAASTLDNRGGRIDARSALTIRADQIDNAGGQLVLLDDGTLQVEAGTLDNTAAGLIAGQGSTTVNAQALNNAGGTVYGKSSLAVTSAGDLTNTNGGVLQSGGALTVEAGGALNNAGGTIESQGATSITANDVINRGGRLVANSGQPLAIVARNTLDNTAGTLGNTQGDVRLSANTIANRNDGGQGRLIAGRDLVLDAASLDNTGGLIQAANDFTYQRGGAVIANAGGELGAGNALNFSLDRLDNGDGKLIATTVNLALRQLDNAGGQVSAFDQLLANLQGFTNTGRLFGGNRLQVNLAGDYLHTGASQLQSNGVLALNIGGALTNQGTLQTQGMLDITASALSNAGLINASNASGTGLTRLTIAGNATNTGRLEGDNVEISAANISNTGTVIGNDIALTAGTITNGRDLGTDVPAIAYFEGLIAALSRIALNADRIDNLDAELYSLGDIHIGGRTGGRAQQFNNLSAKVQAEGDLVIAAHDLNNKRRLVELITRQMTAAEQAAYNRDSAQVLEQADAATRQALTEWFNDYVINVKGHTAGEFTRAPDVRRWHADRYQTMTELGRVSAESQLKAVGDITLDAGNSLTNVASQIAAGRNLAITGTADINNVAVHATLTGTRTEHVMVQKVDQSDPSAYARYLKDGSWRAEWPEFAIELGTGEVITQGGSLLASTVTAGQAVSIEGKNVSNTQVGQGTGAVGSDTGHWSGPGLTGPNLGSGVGVGGIGDHAPLPGVDPITGKPLPPPQVIGSPEVPLPGLIAPEGGLFTQNPDPNASYLVETDPRFANFGQWIASDYLLGLLNFDPQKMPKRLGDGFYEQKLVLDQITQLTGRTFLNQDIGSSLDQYRALMDGAALAAGEMKLGIGVALTAEQVANLQQDIVWMVEQDVGGQKVLVPVVYLSQATADTLRLDGAAIAGETVNINASGNVANSGTVKANSALSIDAQNLLNSGAVNSGGQLRIATIEDAINRGGTISGGSVSIDAGRDLISETKIAGVGGIAATDGSLLLNAGRDLSLTKTNVSASQDLQLSAGRDLTLTASGAKAGGNAVLQAGNDLSLNAQQRVLGIEVNGHTKTSGITQDVSTVQAGGHVLTQAGRDINSQGAELTAGQAIAVQAGRDLNLGAVSDVERSTADYKQGKTQVSERTSDETLRGTTLSAGSDIALSAGRDANLTATTAIADTGGVAIAASRDVNLNAGYEQHDWQKDTSTKKKGLLSSSKTTTHDATQETLAVGTLLSGENVQIAAGRDLTTQAAQVAATHDVVLAAGNNLTIGTAESTYNEQHGQTKTKSGLFSNGGFNVTIGQNKVEKGYELTQTTPEGSLIGSTNGSVTLSAGNDVHITGSDILSNTSTAIVGKNVTIEAALGTTTTKETYKEKQAGINVGLTGGVVAAAEAAYGAAKRGSEVKDDRLKALYAAKAAYAVADGVQGVQNAGTDAGVSLRIGIGASSASSTTTTHDETAYGSRIQSNGDVTIAATGGDLNVIGSQVGGTNVALAAANNLNLLSQAEDHRSESQNKNGSGEIGISIGSTTGIYLTASAGKGKGKGSGTNHVESQINASDTLTLVSGNDTTIKGAQATGNQVLANIGGNLRIESEQDTDDYASKQQQAGISLVYGYSAGGNVSGSYSQQKTNSHYASVNEQSGIAAGSGGFDINVGGNTHLKGGVIASIADPSKNHLSTGSLTVEDIANEASAKTSSAGIGGGTGGNLTSSLVGGGLSMLGGGKENASSTTTSDIAAGTIDIRGGDGTALASLDRTATQFDTDSALKPIDLDKLQEQVELGQVAGEVGFRAAGDMAAAMQKQALIDLATARAEGDTGAENDALARLQSWSDGGTNKTILHGLTGAAVAALGSGDVAQGALGAAGAEKAKQAMGEFLVQQGIAYGSAEYNSLMELGSAALGGAIGGSTGANTGLAGDRFNRQLHPDEISWIKGNAALFAAAEGISQEEAERRLIVEAAARVDAKINHYVGNENVDQAALSFLNRNDTAYDWGKAFQATDAEYTNSTLYADQLSGNLKNFATVYNALAASGVSKDNLQYLYHDQLLAYGQSAVGSSGKGVVGVVGGSAAAGVVAALGQVAVAACFSNPAACSQAVGNGLEVAAGDALGGHSLTAGTSAAVAGGLVAAEKLGQGLAKSQVDEVAKAAAGKVDDVASSAIAAVENKGWKVGSDVYAKTTAGKEPSWSTVRSRFWKNEAVGPDAVNEYGAANVERMKNGLAPQRYNAEKGGMESMELSHEPIPARDGGREFVPRWPQDHAKVDSYRRPGY